MGEKTGISWTDHTFNGWTVCTEVSPGCDNCYARTLAKNRMGLGWGAGVPRHLFKGTWNNPLKWNEMARRENKKHKVFAMSLADWADSEVPKEWRDRFWKLVKDTPWLEWQLLTKRHISRDIMPEDWGFGYPNVWLGVSVESKGYEYRVADLIKIPAKIHWVSAEPLLEDLDWAGMSYLGIDWFVVGGESDQSHKAREFRVDWASNALRECHVFNSKVFVKQLGSNSGLDLKDRHGANINEFPIDLRVQEFPDY